MKKIVYFLLFALCLPIGLMAQSVDDDLYFIPSKDKQEKKETPVKKETKKQVLPIMLSQLAGCIVGVISVVLIAKLMGASDEIIYSLAPKSVTTSIAKMTTCMIPTNRAEMP